MNILFFLTPKEKVSHIFNDDTLRQVVEKMEFHGYSAIPLLDKEGKIHRNNYSSSGACSGSRICHLQND